MIDRKKQSWDYHQYYLLLDNGEICADNYLDNELAKEYGVGTRCFRCGHPLLETDVNVEQDFHFNVKTELGIYDCWESFDIEEEIEMWLDAKRNGCSGVPDILKLVEEEKTIENTLQKLWLETQDWKAKQFKEVF